MGFVLDCSVGISWCLVDEDNAYANAIWSFLSDNEALVPSIFWLELINVFIVSERRGRLTEANAAEALARLRSLRIVVDTNTTQQSIDATWELARQHNLAAYDAALRIALAIYNN